MATANDQETLLNLESCVGAAVVLFWLRKGVWAEECLQEYMHLTNSDRYLYVRSCFFLNSVMFLKILSLLWISEFGSVFTATAANLNCVRN